jgi:hypothetical protein
MKKINLFLTIVVVAILILAGTLTYLELSKKTEQKVTEETSKIIDNRINPLMIQGLTVEFLRIRDRGILDSMLKTGLGWKNEPTFYWICNVDGKEHDSSVSQGSAGSIGSGTFTTWDTILQEGRINFYVDQEKATSDVTITIMERVKTGLIGHKTKDIEREKISLTYDYRTGRWTGDDYFEDEDGVGHYLGKYYELWFNLYESDYDHDGIPYWTEVNVLHTNPMVDDSKLDPDGDGIPTAWEWKWGYDPFTWDDHKNLDPDIDGLTNIQEYQMAKWFADPYQPDIYIETDGMQKGKLLDYNHVLYKDSQEMIIERFAQHGINVYIDDGWIDGPINGGGELLPFVNVIDAVAGNELLGFYTHHFADERKGIFRYLIVANNAGFCIPSKFNYYDTIVIDSNPKKMIMVRKTYTPRQLHVNVAKAALHELGHSLGLETGPGAFPGVDISGKAADKYPSMTQAEYDKYKESYHSDMNYKVLWGDKKFFDYSDGSNGAPYDQNDWDHFYLPTFKVDATSIEEPVDNTFEDIEVVDKNPSISLKGWTYDQNLTNQYANKLTSLAKVKNAKCDIIIYSTNEESGNGRNIRIYAKPNVSPPTHAVWSLIAEGNLDTNGKVQFYSAEKIIKDLMASNT